MIYARTARKFTPEFKDEAVKMVIESSGRSPRSPAEFR